MPTQEIRFTAPGVQRVAGNVRTLAQELRGAASAVSDLNTVTGRAPSRPTISGPAQRLQRIAMAEARGGLSGAEQLDLRIARIRAQRQIERMTSTGGGGFERIAGALLSSRFSVGGGGVTGIQPLVGRTLAAMGVEGVLAGRVALGLGAAGIALTAFTHVLNEARSSVAEFASARMISGGTGGDVARLGAYGVPAGALAGAAAALRQRLASDPYAMGFGRSVGLGQRLGRPYGDTNEAEDLVTAFQGLRKLREEVRREYGDRVAERTQLRAARALGLEEFLPQVNVSPRVVAQQEREAGIRGSIVNREFEQSVNDLRAQLDVTVRLWQDFGMQMAAGPIRWLSEVTAWFNEAGGGGKPADQHARALDRLATALNENTRALQAEGFSGNGAGRGRAAGGLGGALTHEQLRRQAEEGSIWAGSFTP